MQRRPCCKDHPRMSKSRTAVCLSDKGGFDGKADEGTAPGPRGYSSRVRRGRIGQLSQATGAAFVTASDGWVVGIRQASRTIAVIIHTADGGRTWRVQYTLGG